MTARMLNPSVRIICRMTDPKLEPKLKKAGANKVVSPNIIGALRMASEMIRPTVVDFLDSMMRSRKGVLRIHQITISENSEINETSIMQSGIRDKYNLLILGVKHGKDEMEFNPGPSFLLKPGMILVVMGELDNVEKARRSLSI